MVSLAFEELLHKDEFLTFWAPLADHVKAHEPGTLAFELLQPDTEPTELLVYERLVLTVHRPIRGGIRQTCSGHQQSPIQIAAAGGQL